MPILRFTLVAPWPKALIRRVLAVWCVSASVVVSPAAASPGPPIEAASDPVPSTDDPLSAAVQQQLAERFSPILVFHPQEEYFPASPLFALESLGDNGRWTTEGGTAIQILGAPAARRERYRALTLAEKVQLSTVYYRAYRARRDSRPVVVLEYWLYYVQNTYRVRGGVLPFWVDGSHPNDLEHIHIVLRHAESGLVPEEVWASSHDGQVPANRYRYKDTDEQIPEHGRFLVERGSHALAPDIDGDGVFTPGVDGGSGYRLLWGIRDKGIARARYNQSYLDPERKNASIVMVHENDDLAAVDLTYRLSPVDEISQAFADLNLTVNERKQLFEVARNWLRRAFGAENGNSAKLLVPPVHNRDPRSESIGITQMASTERGLLVGGHFKFQEQGAFVGARYAYMHGIDFLPDLMVEADAVQTTRRNYVTTQLLFSYPIDASMKVMAGKAFVTDSWRFDNRQSDWYAGVELRLGSMRISAASRSWGPITNLSKEFRLAYFF